MAFIKRLVILNFYIFFVLISNRTLCQGVYCNVPESSVQEVLDSRRGSSVEYAENVTTGVAFLLGSECDSAISYFDQAQRVTQSTALLKIISQLKINEKKVQESAQPISTESILEVPTDNASTSPVIQQEDVAKNANDTSFSPSSAATELNVHSSKSSLISSEKEFSTEELVAYQQKGLLKVRKLIDYIEIIAQKTTSQTSALATMENAIGLFDSENHSVEVSSKYRPDKSKFPIRTYLNRIRMLNYQKVTIDAASFTYVSNFKLGPDGNYYGIAKFRQLFVGYRENRPIYRDITTKSIAVVLKPYQKSIDGQSQEFWDVFLGDISVINIEP